MLFWFGLGYSMGFTAALYTLIIPILTANFTIMSYIATQHWMLPASKVNNPFRNTLSVDTIPLFDLLHIRFSYHVEHHIFPSMSARFAPLLRSKIEGFAPGLIQHTPHWKALYWLYSTPRIYESDEVLTNIDGTVSVEIPELREKLFGY